MVVMHEQSVVCGHGVLHDWVLLATYVDPCQVPLLLHLRASRTCEFAGATTVGRGCFGCSSLVDM